MQILNMWGDGIVDDIRAAAPDAEIVPVPRRRTSSTRARLAVRCCSRCGSAIRCSTTSTRSASGGCTSRVPASTRWPRPLLEGRTVTCARGVSAIPISEFVLGAMLAFEKDMPDVWLDEPPEHWNIASLGELAGKTVGIVGLGGIGTAVARRALAFDMRVRALRRNPRGDQPGRCRDRRSTWTICSRPPITSSSPRPPPRRRGTCSMRGAFARMKPGVHLVNIARGSLVDQDALRVGARRRSGRVRQPRHRRPRAAPGRALALRSPEGAGLGARLVVVAEGLRRGSSESFTHNLRRYVAGETLHGIVDPDEGY